MESSASHTCVRYRVSYGTLHKEIPTMLLGKLPSKPLVGVAAECTADSAETSPKIGAPVSSKDLGKVVFTSNATFGDGELVIVNRSRGGFTYGRIQSRAKCSCPTAVAESRVRRSADETFDEEVHTLNCWRVQVSETGQHKVCINSHIRSLTWMCRNLCLL